MSLPQRGAPELLGKLQPYSQTLDQAGKDCHDKTLQLRGPINKKNVVNTVPGVDKAKARSLPQSGAPELLGKLQPYSQTLDQAGKDCNDKTLQLRGPINKKNVLNTVPGVDKTRILPQSGAPELLGKLQPYSQTLDQAGKDCHDKTHQLRGPNHKTKCSSSRRS